MRKEHEWICLDCGMKFTEPAKEKELEYVGGCEWENLYCPFCGLANLE
jgi:DNA-directed RNA polymerase subunit RPC12/RpoP